MTQGQKMVEFNAEVRAIALSKETPLFMSEKMAEAVKKERAKILREYNKKSKAFEGCREYWEENGDIRDTVEKVCNISYDEAGIVSYELY